MLSPLGSIYPSCIARRSQLPNAQANGPSKAGRPHIENPPTRAIKPRARIMPPRCGMKSRRPRRRSKSSSSSSKSRSRRRRGRSSYASSCRLGFGLSAGKGAAANRRRRRHEHMPAFRALHRLSDVLHGHLQLSATTGARDQFGHAGRTSKKASERAPSMLTREASVFYEIPQNLQGTQIASPRNPLRPEISECRFPDVLRWTGRSILHGNAIFRQCCGR